MDKDKRNIQPNADNEVKHLMVLLDRSEASEFKKMVPELQDTWVKKQMFRTETEMRFSVLSDNKYGNNASKYWQSVREQNTHFENLMHLSFDYRKNDVEIEKLEHKIIDPNEDKFEKKLAKIELEEKLYSRANMELVAKARMREISSWSKLKKEFDDGSFATRNVNTHQAKALTGFLQYRKENLNTESASDDVFNVMSQLDTIDRLKKEGKINDNEKALPHDQNNPKLSK